MTGEDIFRDLPEIDTREICIERSPVRVWQALLKIPMGRLATYSGIAGKVRSPAAARAVGAAVGKNPIAFVVPCHRVIGKAGELTGYHWGLTRKRAMLGWEAGKMAAAA